MYAINIELKPDTPDISGAKILIHELLKRHGFYFNTGNLFFGDAAPTAINCMQAIWVGLANNIFMVQRNHSRTFHAQN